MTEAGDRLSCEEAEGAIREALGIPGLPAVARHLAGCVACSAEAENVARLTREIRSLPLIEPAQGFWERLLETVPERIHERRRRDSWALSVAAAAALVLVMIAPPDRQQWSLRSAGQWLGEVAIADYGLDSLDQLRTAEEAARVAHRVALAQELGPRAIREMVEVTDQEAVRRRETPVWNLLDSLSAGELERVVARLEKGVGR